MSRMRSIFSHVVAGRLLLLLLITAPPAACTRATEVTQSEPVQQTASKGPVELTVVADAGSLEIGSPMVLEIRAIAETDVDVMMPLVDVDDSAMLGTFHVLEDQVRPDFPDQDRRIWSQRLVLDTFEAGTHPIPAVTARFNDRRGDVEITGSVTTQPLDITITTALAEASEASTLRDIRGPVSIFHLNWGLWILIAGVVAAIIGGLIVLRLKRVDGPATPPLPPHIVAQQQLDVLESEGLLQRRCFQPYYFRLTDILRHYIEGRFGLLAPTRTTPEFLQDMRCSETLLTPQQDQLHGFLRIADLVKFALHEPRVSEGEEALHMARCFVVDTQPRPDTMQEEPA